MGRKGAPVPGNASRKTLSRGLGLAALTWRLRLTSAQKPRYRFLTLSIQHTIRDTGFRGGLLVPACTGPTSRQVILAVVKYKEGARSQNTAPEKNMPEKNMRAPAFVA